MSDELPDELLSQAWVKARRLLKGLEQQQAELEVNPPDLPPEKLAQGRAAMANATAAARRAMAALDEAMKIARADRN